MNLLIDGVRQNPKLEDLKLEFADEHIDWDRNIKIKLNKRYFNMNKGVLDITKKSIEPVYNRVIDGVNKTFRYFEATRREGEGANAVTTYSPTEVDFGRHGDFDFDFTGSNAQPNFALFRWLMNHPMRKTEFDLVRPEKDADDAMETTRKRLKAENMFITKSPAYIDDEKLVVLAASFGLRNAEATPKKQLRLQVMQYALKDVDKFFTMLGSKELETKSLIQEALDLKCLYYDRATATWFYLYPPDVANILDLVVDKNRPIYKVRPHLLAAPNDDFAGWLNDQDGNGHLGTIQSTIMARKDDITRHPMKKGTGAEAIRKFADNMVIQTM